MDEKAGQKEHGDSEKQEKVRSGGNPQNPSVKPGTFIKNEAGAGPFCDLVFMREGNVRKPGHAVFL